MGAPVDSGRSGLGDSGPRVMWSIGQIAERDGITKQAVSKVVGRLVDQGMPVHRDGRGRIAKIPLAWWDEHRGAYVNPAKQRVAASAPSIETPPVRSTDSFDEARRQNEWLKVDAARLARQREQGELLRADRYAAALDQAGREIQAIVSRLPNRADDLALAVSREGSHGLRMMLREVASALLADIADRLAEIAATAPAQDEAIAEVEE